MAKIYKSFDELIKQNESLFKLILKNGHTNLLRACWDARDAELQKLFEDNAFMERELKRALADKEDVEKCFSKSQEHSQELRQYAEQVKNLAESNLREAQGHRVELEALGQANLNLQLQVKQLQDYIEVNRIEVENNLQHGRKLKELVEAANLVAEQQTVRANEMASRTEVAEQLVEEKDQEVESLKTEKMTFLQTIDELESGTKEREAEIQLKDQKLSQLNGQYSEIQATNIFQENLINKLKIEAEEAKLASEQALIRFARLESDYQSKNTHCEELKNYVEELRANLGTANESLARSKQNTDRLAAYADDLEVQLERSETKLDETENYGRECDNYINILKDDCEKLKSEVFRLNAVLKRIQSSLGGAETAGPQNVQMREDVLANTSTSARSEAPKLPRSRATEIQGL